MTKTYAGPSGSTGYTALERLLILGFLGRRRNPNFGWDRKWQYLFNLETVQRAVNRLNMHRGESEDGSRKSEEHRRET